MPFPNHQSKIKNQKSTPPTPWRMLGMGLELGAIIGGLTFLGYLGDKKWGTEPWLALSGALLSTVGGCYNLIKEAAKMPTPAGTKKKKAGSTKTTKPAKPDSKVTRDATDPPSTP